jgi:HlyD family secretion protein
MIMKTGVKWIALLTLLAILIGWFKQEKAIEVTIVNAEFGSVEQSVANTRSGTITACQRARLSLPIGGQIANIYVKEGDIVVKGQPLLNLWNKDSKAKLVEQHARLESIVKTKESIYIAYHDNQTDVTRLASLLEKKLTSQEKLDHAIANASNASCLAATAQIQAHQAMVNTVEAIIEKTQLLAPFKGIIAEVNGEVGEYTTPSPLGVATPPAIDLLTHDCHYITAPIDEVDASLLSLNAPVRISLDAFRGETILGRLRRIAPYVQDYEKQARTVTIEVDFSEHRTPHLLTGYSADVEIILQKKSKFCDFLLI